MHHKFIAAVTLMVAGAAFLPGATAAQTTRDRVAQAPDSVDGRLPYNLNGIGVVAENDAWVVGIRNNPGPRPSEQHWDGQTWARWGHPRMGKRGDSSFEAVDVIAHDDVWAVGTAPNSGRSSPLMMHFDGVRWNRIMPAAIHGLIGHFTAVADAGPNDIWMIGQASDAPGFLAVHWNGEEWKRIDTVDPRGIASSFSGVCKLGQGRALAVGTVQKSGTSEAVAEVWDRSQWSIEETADLQRRHNSFSGVTCHGDDEAWAVGTSSTDTQDTSLVEHRTADGWVRVHEADQPDAHLTGIVALTSGEVWAVGYQSTHGGTEVAPLVEHGVGATWTASTVPYRFNGAMLTCVDADTSNDVWVAGDEGEGGRVFVDHWDGSQWTRTYRHALGR